MIILNIEMIILSTKNLFTFVLSFFFQMEFLYPTNPKKMRELEINDHGLLCEVLKIARLNDIHPQRKVA